MTSLFLNKLIEGWIGFDRARSSDEVWLVVGLFGNGLLNGQVASHGDPRQSCLSLQSINGLSFMTFYMRVQAGDD